MAAETPEVQNWIISIVAFFSAAITGLISTITFSVNAGKRYQKLLDKKEQLETKLKEVSKDQEDMEQEYNRRFNEILNLFKTADGEPAFVTYKAHDKIASRCQKLVNQKIVSGDKLVMAEIKHVKEICERIELRIRK